jgi:hypothetical protein
MFGILDSRDRKGKMVVDLRQFDPDMAVHIDLAPQNLTLLFWEEFWQG